MPELDSKMFLLESKKKNRDYSEIFPQLARKTLEYYIPKKNEDWDGFEFIVKATVDSKVMDIPIIFTDEETALHFCSSLKIDAKIIDYPSRSILQRIINMKLEGALINANDDSQLVLDKKLLMLLFREHLMIDFYMLGGAWCLFVNDQYLIFELLPGIKTIPCFFDKKEAKDFAESIHCNGNARLLPWKVILSIFRKSKCQHLVYAPRQPEMIVIKDPYLSWLFDSPYQELIKDKI